MNNIDIIRKQLEQANIQHADVRSHVDRVEVLDDGNVVYPFDSTPPQMREFRALMDIPGGDFEGNPTPPDVTEEGAWGSDEEADRHPFLLFMKEVFKRRQKALRRRRFKQYARWLFHLD